jgi:lysophospholipase L1-like esterase
MARKWAAASIILALLAGCAERPRSLPTDRTVALVYVALGDSTVEGVGASGPEASYVSLLAGRLRALYPNARAVNLGVGGATSADVVTTQLPRALELSPDLITLSIGPNDITGRVGVDAYEANLDTIFTTLTRRTRAAVIANLLPDLALTPRFARGALKDLMGRRTVAFNEALARAGGKHGIELVDLYATSREEVPRRPELIGADGYHPSDAGYARWAELLWTGVERRLAAR